MIECDAHISTIQNGEDDPSFSLSIAALEGGKLQALVCFFTTLFPGVPLEKVAALMGFGRDSLQLTMSSETRETLSEKLKGVSVELDYRLIYEGQEVMNAPLQWSPEKILKDAKLNVGTTDETTQAAVTKTLIRLAMRELFHTIQKKIDRFSRGLLDWLQSPKRETKLADRRVEIRPESLPRGATIMDVMIGENAGELDAFIVDELFAAALNIQETFIAMMIRPEKEDLESVAGSVHINLEQEILDETIGALRLNA